VDGANWTESTVAGPSDPELGRVRRYFTGMKDSSRSGTFDSSGRRSTARSSSDVYYTTLDAVAITIRGGRRPPLIGPRRSPAAARRASRSAARRPSSPALTASASRNAGRARSSNRFPFSVA
jgi:hypothetical protein